MATKVFAAGTSTIDGNGEIRPTLIHLAAGSANATASILGNGVELAALSALANSNDSVNIGVSHGMPAMAIPPSATIVVVGTGAKVTLVW